MRLRLSAGTGTSGVDEVLPAGADGVGTVDPLRGGGTGQGQAAAAQARAEAAASQPADDVPAAPLVPVVLPAPRPAAVVPDPEPADVDGDQELVLEELTREAGPKVLAAAQRPRY
ncbi:hypothetical protein ACFU9X_36855 [Streptomyces atratus]|uniref:hypothetical protein n=1 Tax=Streptomyces atratus TaxID=1893 RepID=UPI0036811439